MGFGLTGFAPSAAQILLNRVPGASALYMPDRKLSSRIIDGSRTLRTSNNDELDFSPAQIGRGELVDFVNEPIVLFQPPWTSTTNGWSNFSGGATTSREASYTDKNGFTRENILLSSGGETNNLSNSVAGSRQAGCKYRLQGWLLADVAGALNSQLRTASAWNVAMPVEADEWTYIDVEITNGTGTATWNFEFVQTSTAESIVRLSGLVITQLTSNGRTPTLYDWSGNGINATQTTVAAQPFIATAGVLEEGLRFAGGQWLGALDGKTFFDPTTYAFSFSFWARSTTLNSNQNYCGVFNDGTNTFFWARMNFPGKLQFTLRKNGNVSQTIDIESAVSANTWLHYTGVHTGTQIILYKDGNEIGRENIGAGTLSALQYPLVIGSANNRGTISSDFLQGSLTGFVIYPRALTPAEINTVKTLTDPTA
jgi:hypothetical protein